MKELCRVTIDEANYQRELEEQEHSYFEQELNYQLDKLKYEKKVLQEIFPQLKEHKCKSSN